MPPQYRVLYKIDYKRHNGRSTTKVVSSDWTGDYDRAVAEASALRASYCGWLAEQPWCRDMFSTPQVQRR